MCVCVCLSVCISLLPIFPFALYIAKQWPFLSAKMYVWLSRPTLLDDCRYDIRFFLLDASCMVVENCYFVDSRSMPCVYVVVIRYTYPCTVLYTQKGNVYLHLVPFNVQRENMQATQLHAPTNTDDVTNACLINISQIIALNGFYMLCVWLFSLVPIIISFFRSLNLYSPYYLCVIVT